jgi:crotonobetainyl-CoA:carnitine CoA-transferase CaiB-like acyl-CoA transferase
MPAADLPLSGIRVVDLTRILAGPFATMRMGDLGADVLKVENPDGGDDTRGWGPPFVEGVSTYFFSLNRNKRSVALDLKVPEGKDALARLLEGADVLVENFRPGTLERLGFGWDALKARFPRLVYASISGYGHAGRYAQRASYDVVVQGEAGAMDVTGSPEGPPTKFGLSIADCLAGHNAVEGVLAALVRRGRTGLGARVDVSLFDGLLAVLGYQAQMWLSAGKAPRRLGNAHPSIVPYETFKARDAWLNIGVANEALWARFCEALGRPEWAADPRFATNKDRVTNRDALVPLVALAVAARDADDWIARLDAAGIPCGRIRTVPEALALAEADARAMVVAVDHPDAGRQRMLGNPVKVGPVGPGAEAMPLRPPPRLGEHTDEVLREAGFTAEEVAALRAKGVAG